MAGEMDAVRDSERGSEGAEIVRVASLPAEQGAADDEGADIASVFAQPCERPQEEILALRRLKTRNDAHHRRRVESKLGADRSAAAGACRDGVDRGSGMDCRERLTPQDGSK
jgi:hypothetical protein